MNRKYIEINESLYEKFFINFLYKIFRACLSLNKSLYEISFHTKYIQNIAYIQTELNENFTKYLFF